MNQMEIGRFIAACRKEKGMTQAQLASRLGISDKSISRWENGSTMPDLSLYEPLCKELDIEVSELLYAKKLSDPEKAEKGENSALSLFQTKARLETFAIFTEILIVVGIVISITLTGVLADTAAERIITLVPGWFVWGFGLVLRVRIKNAIAALEEQ